MILIIDPPLRPSKEGSNGIYLLIFPHNKLVNSILFFILICYDSEFCL